MGAHDAFLLDAYSHTLSEVVDRLAPSAVAVRVEINCASSMAPAR